MIYDIDFRQLTHRGRKDHRFDQMSMLMHRIRPSLKLIVARLLYKKIGRIRHNTKLLRFCGVKDSRNRSMMLFNGGYAINMMKTQVSRHKIFHQCNTNLTDDVRDGAFVVQMKKNG